MANLKNIATMTYDCFVFTHIQKTAGTSMRKVIADACVKNGIASTKVHIPGMLGLGSRKNTVQATAVELIDLENREVKVMLEHISYNAHLKPFLKHVKHPFYFTILREPAERFISYYYFFYYKKKPGYDALLNDLEDVLFQNYVTKFQNLMTAYVGGVAWFLGIDKTVDDAVCKTALYNLEHNYGTFGIQEDMKLTFDKLINRTPSWLKIEAQNLPILNNRTSNQNDKLKGKKLAIFNEANIFDLELYAFAKDLFYS